MSLVLTRIDNRLIHGQVLEAWVPYIHADCIVVANDEVAVNSLKRMMMEASVPSRIRVEIGSVESMAVLLAGEVLAHHKVLLLFASTEDALRAYRYGLKYSQLNLGNLHAGVGREQLSCTIFIDAKGMEDLTQLDSAGVVITARCIPSDHERSWQKLVQTGGA